MPANHKRIECTALRACDARAYTHRCRERLKSTERAKRSHRIAMHGSIPRVAGNAAPVAGKTLRSSISKDNP
jgi:hypothetical protein